MTLIKDRNNLVHYKHEYVTAIFFVIPPLKIFQETDFLPFLEVCYNYHYTFNRNVHVNIQFKLYMRTPEQKILQYMYTVSTFTKT
jgi:hypothetical protein